MFYKLGRGRAARWRRSAPSTSPPRSRPGCATCCSPARSTRRYAARDARRRARSTTPWSSTRRPPGGSPGSSTSTPRSPGWPRSGRSATRPTRSCGCCAPRRPPCTWSRCSRRCRCRRRSTASPSCAARTCPVGGVVVNQVRRAPLLVRPTLRSGRDGRPRPGRGRGRAGARSASPTPRPPLVEGAGRTRPPSTPSGWRWSSRERAGRSRTLGRPTYELPLLAERRRPRRPVRAGRAAARAGRGVSPSRGRADVPAPRRRRAARPTRGTQHRSCAAAPAASARPPPRRRSALRAAEPGRTRRGADDRPGAAAGPVDGAGRARQHPARRCPASTPSAGGALDAMMLDMKRTFDEVVEAHADAGQRRADPRQPLLPVAVVVLRRHAGVHGDGEARPAARQADATAAGT